ncbi:MAG: biopolymer transporter ExbD [candidate division KSB1 bacterium]|nr:biopolymer transporter ExbD [candidate division KSB1 bacterium]MDZ7276077.1 biopolymer transporter ExbD [candidate division KSB1 bacterium]MDZ7287143.1 biopolymer transporter ExbD [candidate division KSB1 bacterium]MDZ7296932.1 biopolymer transporter ExbD [candidate division KSB1 bacterium]MDZ7309389.1 biopolymer transporter ExbD [candidate division KSB1 bacterium]
MDSGKPSGDIISNLNLAPLVDIALVLVIIFMVTAPLLDVPSNLAVDLPKAATVEAKSQDNITISLAAGGEIALNDQMLAPARLAPALKKMVNDHPNRLVVIRADKNVSHRQILDLLSLAKKNGAKRIAIATVQRR